MSLSSRAMAARGAAPPHETQRPTKSSPPSARPPSVEARDSAEHELRAIVGDARVDRDTRGRVERFHRNHALTRGERSRLEEARNRLAVDMEEAASAEEIATVFEFFRKSRVPGEGADLAAIAAAYDEALSSIPAAALDEARYRIHTGAEPDVSPKFMPGASEIAAVARRAGTRTATVRQHLDRALAAPTEGEDESPPAARRAHAQAVLQRVKPRILEGAAAMAPAARFHRPVEAKPTGEAAIEAARKRLAAVTSITPELHRTLVQQGSAQPDDGYVDIGHGGPRDGEFC